MNLGQKMARIAGISLYLAYYGYGGLKNGIGRRLARHGHLVRKEVIQIRELVKDSIRYVAIIKLVVIFALLIGFIVLVFTVLLANLG